jgi:hypothetical protein
MKREATLPVEVEELRQRLNTWREQTDREKRLPESLWEEAAVLARNHGVSLVAVALSLSYTALKLRAAASTKSLAVTTQPTFVEVGMVAAAVGSECLVELRDGSNGQMNIRLDGGATGALLALTQAFWRRSL